MNETNETNETMEDTEVKKMPEADAPEAPGDAIDPPDPSLPKRRVVVSQEVKATFSDDVSDKIRVVMCKRDIFSVSDAILQEVAKAGKDSGLKVTVHSVEDIVKSEPPKEGEPYWEGPYFVGNLSIEDMPADEALGELAKLTISPFIAMKAVEGFVGNFFLRSKIDALVFCATFNGTDVTIPMANSLHPPRPEAFVRLYRQLQKTAEDVRSFALERYNGDIDESAFSGERKPAKNEVVAPDRTIVTPEEAMKDKVRVVEIK